MADHSGNSAEKQLRILPPSIVPDAFYTTQETCDYLRITRRTLERYRREGKGPRTTRLWSGGRPMYFGQHIIDAINAAGNDDGNKKKLTASSISRN